MWGGYGVVVGDDIIGDDGWGGGWRSRISVTPPPIISPRPIREHTTFFSLSFPHRSPSLSLSLIHTILSPLFLPAFIISYLLHCIPLPPPPPTLLRCPSLCRYYPRNGNPHPQPLRLMAITIHDEKQQKFHWVGVFWNVVSVLIVGGTALLASSSSSISGSTGNVTASETLLGVMLMIAGAFVQAIQFVFEEKVMKMDVPVPPLLLIGMEGFWGVVVGIFVMYPIGYILPGDDHGSYEDPFNTWAMLVHSRNIQIAFSIYFFTIFMYNVFAVLVTFQLSSIWHAILDNFRPITVWATDLFIFYYINPLFGEVWTRYSYLQIVGMAVLLYGTAIYNAPNDGSLLLGGQWWAFGIDLSEEYDEIRREQEEAELEAQWDKKQQEFKKKRLSSFMTSPKISVHTQALVGIGAQRY
ncbi:hypothetical protein ACHAXA_006448 [Cyclostephanos tholiformis]|uniref:Uncharacterized protein n=1 Tax=Cyclostephanos tholiformis TaxID=382380 RepID=A0ABD3SF39_9STRA